MIKFENITKKYGSHFAVKNINLTISKGEMIGIIGSSGAGKSTLLRLINRLCDSDNGNIFYNDKNITSLKGRRFLEWRSKCAMIFQQFNLVQRLDVLTNVLSGRLFYNSTFL